MKHAAVFLALSSAVAWANAQSSVTTAALNGATTGANQSSSGGDLGLRHSF